MGFFDSITFTDVVQLIISLATVGGLAVSVWQNKQIRNQANTDLFVKYSSRYAINKEISNVVMYLEHLDGLKHNKEVKKPDGHDVEMFMRFFEELDMLIESKQMDKNKVYYMFAYYLLVFDSHRSEFNITDYDSGCWKHFKNIVIEMNKIKNK